MTFSDIQPTCSNDRQAIIISSVTCLFNKFWVEYFLGASWLKIGEDRQYCDSGLPCEERESGFDFST
jgi:hypothetical protein